MISIHISTYFNNAEYFGGKIMNRSKTLDFFHQISQVPRCSGNEKPMQDFLAEYASKRQLDYTIEDLTGNIIIRKPASKGFEKAPVVILQGHIDMVCEKNKETVHDFTKDKLRIIEKDGFLMAEGTTLGADNGIGVAYCLSILDSDDLQHPSLEVLLTTDEETSMKGAENLKSSSLRGSILLNLDAEEEGVFYVSSAGGIDHYIEIPFKKERPSKNKAMIIEISGLSGGHSGSDINLERGNSIKILARILYLIKEEVDFEISSINGGSKINAIPRESQAIFFVDEKDIVKVNHIVKKAEQIIKNELKDSDNISILCKKTHAPEYKIDNDSVKRLLDALIILPNGVDKTSMQIDGLVISSLNVGVLTDQDEKFIISTSVRSSVESLKRNIVVKLDKIAEVLALNSATDADYPEWEYMQDSPVREIAIKVFKSLYDKEPTIKAIHAGLESGFFARSLKENKIDILSFGPDMQGVHSPDEKVSIESVERVYTFLTKLLKEINQ